MTQEEITQGNILIAEFYVGKRGPTAHVLNLKYHFDWNWIIQAWKKFYHWLSIEYYNACESDVDKASVGYFTNQFNNAVNIDNPLAAFKVLVEAITFLNKQKA